MMMFWLVCGVFIIIALAFILPPLWQSDDQIVTGDNEPREHNISIYKDQLSELESDLRNGIVSREQYEQDSEEIKRRLLEDVSTLQEQDEQDREEIKRWLLEDASTVKAVKRSKHPKAVLLPKPAKADRLGAYAIAITLPILAIGLYAKLGNTNARSEQPQTAPPQPASTESPGGMSQAQIEENVAKLAKRMESNPSDVQGWMMLARSYSNLGKFDESSKAYEKAVALKPRDADLLARYAFSLGMANGRNFSGRPTELINQALQMEPDNLDVLGLAGGVAFEQKNYKQAIEHWTKLLAKAPPNSDLAQAVNEKLQEAKTLAGDK
jgi:cytochrome c-type biogenesis protein CcmH